MEQLTVACPFCKKKMTMGVDLMIESISYYCDCNEYIEAETEYISELLSAIEVNE